MAYEQEILEIRVPMGANYLFTGSERPTEESAGLETVPRQSTSIGYETRLEHARYISEERIREAGDPKELFMDLGTKFRLMQDLEYDKFIAANILVALRYHKMDLESLLCMFEGIRAHLESPVKEYHERGSLLTSVITENKICEDISEYEYFKQYINVSFEHNLSGKKTVKWCCEVRDESCGERCAQKNGNDTSQSSDTKKHGGKKITEEFKSVSAGMFREKFEVKSEIPIKLRRYRYIQEALAVLESKEKPGMKHKAFMQMPSLINKASTWMLKTVFETTFCTLVRWDGCEDVVVEGLQALCCKFPVVFYMAIDLLNSRESSLRIKLALVEFASRTIEAAEMDTAKMLLKYLLDKADQKHLGNSFVVHNIACLLHRFLERLGLSANSLQRRIE